MKVKPKILVIDDSSTHLILCETIFEEGKYDLRIADNGKDGLKAINKFHPDIILLDLMMPGIDGFLILETIKSKEETKNIPVIVVSAKEYIEDITRAKELGAIDFVGKPIGCNDLFSKVNNILEMNQI